MGDNLDIFDISTVSNASTIDGKTPFDLIDETSYGKEKMNITDKIKWVCENFEITQNNVETDKKYLKRIKEEE